MLVISRKFGESFDVDGPATVTILRIGTHGVSIGIDAPLSTNVTRPDAKKKLPTGGCVQPFNHKLEPVG